MPASHLTSFRHIVRISLIALTAVLSTACASSRQLHVSSLESIYSPSGEFWGSTRASDSAVFIRLDSALVVVSGDPAAIKPPRMTNLYLRALLVTTRGQHWRPLATSEPLLVGDTLRWGESRHVGPHEFALQRSREIPLDSTWVVFEFQGGNLSPGDNRHVQTFACSPTNLAGRSAEARQRAAELQRDYLHVC